MNRRRFIVAGLLVLSVAYLVAGGLGQPTKNPAGQELNRSKLVQPEDNGSYFWPYTSRERSTSGRTLAINLLIHGSDDRVQTVLTEQTALDWELATNGTSNATNATAANATNATAANATNATAATQPLELDKSVISWNDAHGSTRYSYIDARPGDGRARWLDESFQVHAGDYFGSRYHIRAYTAPRTNWTAVQIHYEYWDWFRLRHTVTDIRDSRVLLERDFIGQPYVQSVSREYYGVNGGWNDGWITEITLVPALVLFALGSLLSRQTRRSMESEVRRLLAWTGRRVRGFVLTAVLAGLYLSVRSAGLLMESTVQDVDPRVFLAVLYPAIALGLPILAAVFARPYGATDRLDRFQRVADRLGPPLTPLAAFGFAVAGLGLGLVFDFGGIGVRKIPVQLALHRVGLVVALGLIAAGSARVDERGAGLLALGVIGWITGLVMPLLGYL